MTDEQRRSERRAWIAEHHPDHGGDPDAFAAGLARFDSGSNPAPQPERMAVTRSRNPVRRARRWIRNRRRGTTRRLL